MRHSTTVSRTCQTHLFTLILATSLLLPAIARAQAAVGIGYTRQRVSASNRREILNGYTLDVAIPVAARLGLVFGGGQMGHDGNSTRDEFLVGSFRAGIQIFIARSRAADLTLGTGLGLHSLGLDREEDGAGSTVYIHGQLTVHPVPVLGIQLGGIAQSFSGFQQTIGGSSFGLTLGIQLRSSDW